MLNQQHGALCCLGPSPRGGILNGYSPVNPVCGSGVKGLPSHAIEMIQVSPRCEFHMDCFASGAE